MLLFYVKIQFDQLWLYMINVILLNFKEWFLKFILLKVLLILTFLNKKELILSFAPPSSMVTFCFV